MIKSPPQKYNPTDVEKKILKFWEEQNIFKKSIEQRKNCKHYVFLEGPPTANGMPHPGHILTRVMKDLILRYQTTKGHYILRKAGWDTHGLPVEIEVEKELGIQNKSEIPKYGVAKYNAACKSSVFKYLNLWEQMTTRMGYWINLDSAYVTFKNEYIESVWWALS